jgi:acetyl esterase/lipase
VRPEDRSVFELPTRTCARIEKYGEDPDNFIEIFESSGQSLGQIVLIHGGFWHPEYDLSHLRPFAGALSDAGWRVQLVEYRRILGKPDNYLADIRAAIIQCGGGVLIGHSAGGHLALLASDKETEELITGVIALAPVGDMVGADSLNLDGDAIRVFLGDSAVNRPDLDPNLTLTKNVPVLIIHGIDDIRVPIALSHTLYNSYKTAGLECEFIELIDTGHFEVIDYRAQPFTIILDHLKKLV